MNRDLAVLYFVVYLCLYLFEVEGVEKHCDFSSLGSWIHVYFGKSLFRQRYDGQSMYHAEVPECRRFDSF